VRRLAQKMKHYVKYWALEGEPQSNGLAVGEYAARVLPVLSTAVRDGAGLDAVLLGGGIVNGFRDQMWNNTMNHHQWFDGFAFHPYRFHRLDPEASCLGQCGSTFRSQLLTANQDLARVGAAPRVYLTEEATGVTLQRTRALGWPAVGGYDLSMRLRTFSQQELLMANYIARMWVTAMGERAIGYNLHGGNENLLFLDDVGTPTLGAVAIYTMASTLRLGWARSAGRLLNETMGPGPGPGNTVPLPTGPFRAYLFSGAGHSGEDLVAAMWTADSEFATVHGALRLSGLTKPQLNVATVIDTYGHAVPTRIVDGNDGSWLEVPMGRDVLYMVFPSGSTRIDQVRAAVTRMLVQGAGQVGGSLTWPTQFW
jgi:hypothetical protein